MKLSKNKIIKLLQKKNQSYKKTNLAKRKSKTQGTPGSLKTSSINKNKKYKSKRNKTLKCKLIDTLIGGVKLDPSKISEKSSEEQVAKSKQEFAQAAESNESLSAFKEETQSKHTWSNPFFGEAKPRHSEILNQIDFISKRNELMKNPVIEEQLTKEILDDVSNTFNSQWRHIVNDAQSIGLTEIINNGIGIDADGAITSKINKTENKINEVINKLNELNKALKNPASNENKELIMSLGENAQGYDSIINAIKNNLDLLQKQNVVYSDILALQNDIICLGGGYTPRPPTSLTMPPFASKTNIPSQASQFESAEEKSMSQCKAELEQWKLKQEKLHKDEYDALMKNTLSALYSIDCSNPEIAEPNCLNYNLNDIKVGQQISKNKQLLITAYEKIRKEKEETILPEPEPSAVAFEPETVPSKPLVSMSVPSKPSAPMQVESIELAPQGEETKPAIMETSFIEPQEEPVVEEPKSEPVVEEVQPEPRIEEVENVPQTQVPMVEQEQPVEPEEEGYVAVEQEDLPSQRQQVQQVQAQQVQAQQEQAQQVQAQQMQEPRIEEVELIPSEQAQQTQTEQEQQVEPEEEGYVAIEREDLPSQRRAQQVQEKQTEQMQEPRIEEVEILPAESATVSAAPATSSAKRSQLFRPWEEYDTEGTEAETEASEPQTTIVQHDDGSKEILIKIVVPPKSQTAISAPGGDDVEATLLGIERDISKTQVPQITVNIPSTALAEPALAEPALAVSSEETAQKEPELETPQGSEVREVTDEELQRRLNELRDEPQEQQTQKAQESEAELVQSLLTIDPTLLQSIEDALARNPTYEETLAQEAREIPLIGREEIRMAPFTRPFGPGPYDTPYPTPPSSIGTSSQTEE